MLFFFAFLSFSAIVGIDIGTESIKIGAIATGKNVEIVLNRYSKRQTPTLISFESKTPIASDFVDQIDRRIGLDALPVLHRNSSAVIRGFPSIIGKVWSNDFQEFLNKRYYDYSMVSNRINGVSVDTLIAMLFEECIHYAEEQLSIQNIKDIVITVPAFFTDLMKEQYLKAAKMIGLNVLQITDEKSSLTTLYALEKTNQFRSNEKKVCFVDIGAGKTSITGAKFSFTSKANINELEYVWDDTLGGIDIDISIASYLKEKFKLDKVSQDLIMDAQKIKHALTISDKANISSELIEGRIIFTIDEMNQCLAPFLLKLETLLSNITEKYDSIELIGGVSRIPSVINLVSKVLGNTSRTLNSDEANVVGCTYIGAMLSKSFRLPSFIHNKISIYDISIQIPAKTIPLFKIQSTKLKPKIAKLDTKTNFSLIYTSKVPCGSVQTIRTWQIIFDSEIPKIMRAIITIGFDDSMMLHLTESKLASKAENGQAYMGSLTLKVVDTVFDESEFVYDMNKALIASFTSHYAKTGKIARAKNDFESLLFQTKGAISKEYAKIITEEEKKYLEELINEDQHWLETNGEEITDILIIERHQKLFNYLQPIKQRAAEREKLKEAVEKLREVIKTAKKKSHQCGEAGYSLRESANGVNDWLKTKVHIVTHNEGTVTGEDVDTKRYYLETLIAKCQNIDEL